MNHGTGTCIKLNELWDWYLSHTEQREIYAAIAAMLQEMGMIGEIVVFAVFKNKDSLWG